MVSDPEGASFFVKDSLHPPHLALHIQVVNRALVPADITANQGCLPDYKFQVMLRHSESQDP